MKEEDKHIEPILARVLTEQGSQEDNKLIEKWRNESEENQRIFSDYEKILKIDRAHFNSSEYTIDENAEWNKFQESISHGTKTVSMNQGTGFNWMKVAAAVVLLIASSYFIYSFLFSQNFIEYQTADIKQEITLPDNSVITLNANSYLSYSEDFGKENRKVELKGEAFFEVERNESLPFIISANDAEVKVLGTSFNVFTSDEVTEVVVSSGLVSLSSKENKNSIQLSAGDAGKLTNKQELTPLSNEYENYLAWKTGIIVFEETSLIEVIHVLNRAYHTNISIAEGISKTCAVTVSFDNQSLESVLNVLTSTLDLTITKNGQTIEITQAGC